MLNNLINSDIGFAWGVRAIAFISLGCLIVGNALIFVPRNPTSPSSTAEHLEQTLTPEKPPLWDMPYTLTLTSVLLLTLGTNTPPFFLQLFAEKKGVNRDSAFYSLAIMNAGSIAGRIVPNWIADKLGTINVYIPLLVTLGECT